ncbi:MAG: hypothetical protein ACLR1G_04445 [Alistipes indistinctus]
MNRIGKYEGVVRLVLLLVVLPAAVYRLSLGRTVALWGEVRRTERTLAEAESASCTTGCVCRHARYGGTDRRRRSARSAGAP